LPPGVDAGETTVAPPVDGNGYSAPPRGDKYMPRKPVAGLFGPDGIPCIQQNSRRNLQSLLGPGNDHYLLRLAAHRARGPQVRANRFAQRLRAPRPSVLKRAHVRISSVAHHQARPYSQRELIDSRLAQAERTAAT